MDSLIKCLGKWYDTCLKDSNNIQCNKYQFQEGYRPNWTTRKNKTWLFQLGLLPRLMWPLMLTMITTSTVEGFEKKINRHILGFHPVSLVLDSRTNQLQLPLSSLVEEFKVAKGKASGYTLGIKG